MTTTTTSPSASPPNGSANLSTALIDAWQAALGAEHAAVFGYGGLGPRFAPTQGAVARGYEAAHRLLRDQTSAALQAGGITPVPSRSDYPVPATASTAPPQVAVLREALGLEEAAAAAWRFLLLTAATDSAPTVPTSIRTAAQAALDDSAVRALHWRALLDPAAPSVPFPGL